MFKLEMQWEMQGEWIPTVYTPREYFAALDLLNEYSERWANVHNYRIRQVETTTEHDTPMFDEIYGG
jgi:hypothetical protein